MTKGVNYRPIQPRIVSYIEILIIHERNQMEIKKKPFFKSPVGLVIIGIVVIGIIFVAGDEYRAYKVRKALREVFDTPTPESSKDKTILNKNIGDVFQLAMGTVKINSSEEKNVLSGGSFGDPVSAKENTKFVVVNLDITNTTGEKIMFSDRTSMLIDDQNRIFEPYDDTIGNVDNYLDVRDLSPSITENGVIVFEIPNDATSYAFAIDKNGTKERYMVKLK